MPKIIYTALGLMGNFNGWRDASIIESDGNREYTTKFDKYFEYGHELQQN